LLRKQVFIQPIEFPELSNMTVAHRGITHPPAGTEAYFKGFLSGQKKRTNSGRTRRRPSFLMCISADRPESRSWRVSLVPLIRYCQLFATFGPAPFQDIATGLGGHAGAEAVSISALATGGLIRAFHRRYRSLFQFDFIQENGHTYPAGNPKYNKMSEEPQLINSHEYPWMGSERSIYGHSLSQYLY
jgi:hypothetical protein